MVYRSGAPLWQRRRSWLVFFAGARGEEVEDDFTGTHKDRDGVRRLQIVKNRLEGHGSPFLKMAGQDRFDRVDFKVWKAGERKGEPRARRAESEIRLLLSDGDWHSRTDIIDAIKGEHIGRNVADGALDWIEASCALEPRRLFPGSARQSRPREAPAGCELPAPDDDAVPTGS